MTRSVKVITTRCQRRQRGFAALMAVMLIPIAGLAMLALSQHLAAESRRTTGAQQDAQLRQLLRAGTKEALIRVQANGAAIVESLSSSVTVPCPATVAGAEPAFIRLTAEHQGNAVLVHVTASSGGVQRRESMRFTRQLDRLELVGIEVKSIFVE